MNPDAPDLDVAWSFRGSQRLVNYLMKFTVKDHTTGCRMWTGWTDGNGYSCMAWRRADGTRQVVRTYRLIVETITGPIPEGYTVHHTCGRVGCVSPNHLERSDQRANVGEMLARNGFLRYIAALRDVVRKYSPAHPILAERADTYDGSNERKPNAHSYTIRWRRTSGILPRR